MDNKKTVKDFIMYVCNWIEIEYRSKNSTHFCYKIEDEDMSCLLIDKAIERRIQNELKKRIGVDSYIVHNYSELKIRLYNKERYCVYD